MQKRYEQYREILKKSELLEYPVKKICEEYQMRAEERHNIEEQTSSFVLAPALNGFVVWVLQNVLKKGVQRLYFLARDGYFMYRIACRYCEEFNLPLECMYLCCSRYSLRIPAYHTDMKEALSYICRGGIDVTLQKILDRSGITWEEQKEVLKQLQEQANEQSGKESRERKSDCFKDLSEFMENPEKVIPYAKLEVVRELLEKCTYFLNCVEKHSREAMPELRGYLKSVGLLEDTKAVLVDSGWVGSMQKVLNQTLRQMGRKDELEGYYWGIYELPEAADPMKYHCYYFSPRKELRAKVYFSNCLFESIFSAPHGMTLGYRKREEHFEPYFSECSRSHRIFMEETERHLLRYTDMLLGEKKRRMMHLQEKNKKKQRTEMMTSEFMDLNWKKARKVTKKLLYLFMGKPTHAEAASYGALRFSDDVLDTDTKRTAEQMTEKELCENHVWNKMLVMFGIRKTYIKESAWYEGSARLFGENVRRHWRQYAIYKYLLYIRQGFLKG